MSALRQFGRRVRHIRARFTAVCWSFRVLRAAVNTLMASMSMVAAYRAPRNKLAFRIEISD